MNKKQKRKNQLSTQIQIDISGKLKTEINRTKKMYHNTITSDFLTYVQDYILGTGSPVQSFYATVNGNPTQVPMIPKVLSSSLASYPAYLSITLQGVYEGNVSQTYNFSLYAVLENGQVVNVSNVFDILVQSSTGQTPQNSTESIFLEWTIQVNIKVTQVVTLSNVNMTVLPNFVNALMDIISNALLSTSYVYVSAPSSPQFTLQPPSLTITPAPYYDQISVTSQGIQIEFQPLNPNNPPPNTGYLSYEIQVSLDGINLGTTEISGIPPQPCIVLIYAISIGVNAVQN